MTEVRRFYKNFEKPEGRRPFGRARRMWRY